MIPLHLQNDIADATVCQVTQDVIVKSISLLEKYSLRTLDALHTATVKIEKPDLFVSADKRQIEAALREKIQVKSLAVLLN